MTKASVFPLPVTCGREALVALPLGSSPREDGTAASAQATHRFGGDILVSQEQRDGRGLERGKALVRECHAPPGGQSLSKALVALAPPQRGP